MNPFHEEVQGLAGRAENTRDDLKRTLGSVFAHEYFCLPVSTSSLAVKATDFPRTLGACWRWRWCGRKGPLRTGRPLARPAGCCRAGGRMRGHRLGGFRGLGATVEAQIVAALGKQRRRRQETGQHDSNENRHCASHRTKAEFLPHGNQPEFEIAVRHRWLHGPYGIYGHDNKCNRLGAAVKEKKEKSKKNLTNACIRRERVCEGAAAPMRVSCRIPRKSHSFFTGPQVVRAPRC